MASARTTIRGAWVLFAPLLACSSSRAHTAPSQECEPDATPSCSGPAGVDGSAGDDAADASDATAGHIRFPSSVSEAGLASADASLDTGAGESSVPFTGEASHAPLPQLVYQGGPVLTATRAVTVTFVGDALAPDLDSFGATVTSNPWWSLVSAGFCEASGPCVGAVSGASVSLGMPAAASYTDSIQGGPSSIQDLLRTALDQNVLPAPDPGSPSSTVYVLYVPTATTVSLDGDESCADGGFGGYHSAMSYGSGAVPYAVVAECEPEPRNNTSLPSPSVLQETTLAASHELLETATDPVDTGYWLDPTDEHNWGWMDVSGSGEVADLCVDFFELNQDFTTEGAFTVQRMWSNARAAQGIDPCVPAPPDSVYFNVAPERSFFVLDVGQSVTFDADAFSSGSMADWVLGVQDWTVTTSTQPYLSFSIVGARQDRDGPSIAVRNGSTVQVTATLLRDPGSLAFQEADGALVSAAYDATTQPIAAHYFPFAVMSSTTAVERGVDAAGVDRWAHGLARPGHRDRLHPLHALPR
jgi:hypothetical protein